MSLQQAIEARLREALAPSWLQVINESHSHNVAPGSETHFRVTIVSSAFEGKPVLQRHRMVYELLEQERAQGIHALGIQTLTPEEHRDASTPTLASPPCLGGKA